MEGERERERGKVEGEKREPKRGGEEWGDGGEEKGEGRGEGGRNEEVLKDRVQPRSKCASRKRREFLSVALL